MTTYYLHSVSLCCSGIANVDVNAFTYTGSFFILIHLKKLRQCTFVFLATSLQTINVAEKYLEICSFFVTNQEGKGSCFIIDLLLRVMIVIPNHRQTLVLTIMTQGWGASDSPLTLQDT